MTTRRKHVAARAPETAELPIPRLSDCFPVYDVPNRLPPRSDGSRVHTSAVYRWALYGIQGHRLRTLRAGGRMLTCEAWLTAFFGAISAARDAEGVAS